MLVVVLAALGFGVRVAWARSSSSPQVVAPGPAGSALTTRTASHTASSSTASGGGGPPAQVTVHVVGEVRKAGVLTLPPGSRVADAVARAGGARAGADLGAVNLARLLVDGEQVRIPQPGEPVSPGGSGAGTGSGSGSGGGVAASGAGTGGGTGGAAATAASLLNLNTATAAQFEELPGVGPVLAQRIVDWRTEHGRFASVDELGEVSGIGEKIFTQLQSRVTV